jgi:hypothetical protein
VCSCVRVSLFLFVKALIAFVAFTFILGFGRCSLPVRQVILLAMSLIATIVYLRWKESLSQQSIDSSTQVPACAISTSLNFHIFLSEEQIVEQLGACGADNDC